MDAALRWAHQPVDGIRGRARAVRRPGRAGARGRGRAVAAGRNPRDPIDGAAVYCCGPSGLIAAVEAQCRGWPAGSLRVERFTAVAATDRPRRPIEVVCTRSGLRLRVPPDRSILEVAEEAGLNPASSCTEGICGSCETTVIEGEPEHLDALLTEQERAGGRSMLICVSRARTRTWSWIFRPGRRKETTMTEIQDGWYLAAWSEEVVRTLSQRWIAGNPVCFYRLSDGTAVAFEDRCPHRRYPPRWPARVQHPLRPRRPAGPPDAGPDARGRGAGLMKTEPRDGYACHVTWVPEGQDLRSTCSCGATRTVNDPAGTWDWFSAHLDTAHTEDAAFDDIPGTTVYTAERARRGYHLNRFCMSLMTAERRPGSPPMSVPTSTRGPCSKSRSRRCSTATSTA